MLAVFRTKTFGRKKVEKEVEGIRQCNYETFRVSICIVTKQSENSTENGLYN